MAAAPGKRVAIVQSNYIPWKGYFDLIAGVDEFILYDDVQYTRRDWRNRNRIKTPTGAQWLTIPVEVKGKYLQRIRDVRISDRGWAATHWKTLAHHYARAAHFRALQPTVESWYDRVAALELLTEVNESLLRAVCDLLGIGTRITRSSDYAVAPDLPPTDRLVALCQHAGARTYLSGPAARAYLDTAAFDAVGIGVEWKSYDGYPEYPQLHPPFDHAVTVLDLLFNTGAEARRYLKAAAPSHART